MEEKERGARVRNRGEGGIIERNLDWGLSSEEIFGVYCYYCL